LSSTKMPEKTAESPFLDVVAAVIARKHKDRVEVLIFQRSPEDSGAGNWEFPGGKVEPQESEPQALRREILEELSIAVQVRQRLAENHHRYPKANIHLKAYLCQPEAPDFESRIVLADHQAFRWVTHTEIKEVTLSPADVPLLEDIFAVLDARSGS
jgi:8-oxo-dGTP diphosphatase